MHKSKGTIIYIGGFEMPDKNAAAHRVLNNAKCLGMLGYKIVFCGVDSEEKESDILKKVASFDNRPLKYPKSAGAWIKYLVDFAKVQEIIEEYSDVKYILAYNMHAIPLAKLLNYCKKRNIKLIADVTEWYENKFSFHPIKLIKCIDTIVVMRFLQKKVDGMIVISSFLEDYYKKYVPSIVIVPPLIDVEDTKWLQPLQKQSKKLEFVYSGVPGTDKDKIGQIVENFFKIKIVREYHLKVIGITKNEFLAVYPHQEQQILQMQDKLTFCGRVSHKESIAALLNADYGIFVRDRSRKNMAGFPTKFVECYTSGINIIANDVSDIKKYFPKEGNSILINNSTDHEITNALRQVFQQTYEETEKFREIRRMRGTTFDYREWKKVFEQLFD